MARRRIPAVVEEHETDGNFGIRCAAFRIEKPFAARRTQAAIELHRVRGAVADPETNAAPAHSARVFAAHRFVIASVYARNRAVPGHLTRQKAPGARSGSGDAEEVGFRFSLYKRSPMDFSSTPDLIARWRACPLDTPPYLFPGDERRTLESATHPHKSFRDYIESSTFGVTDARLHLGLLPVPYTGDLVGAKIYILMLNPGFSPADYYAESHSAEFREAMIGNIRQDRVGEYPFLYLDPRFAWHPGFTYWHSRLQWLVSDLTSRDGVAYHAALAKLARSICAIELVPYHSATFGLSERVIQKLESVWLAKDFVRESVVPRAQAGEVALVVTRSASLWGFSATDENENIVVYNRFETRRANLGRRSRGGRVMARRLEIPVKARPGTP